MSLTAEPAKDPMLETLKTLVLADPTAFQTRLASLQKASEEADAKIALAGKAEDIVALHEDATAKALDAAKALEDAKSKSDFLAHQAASSLSDAQAQAEKILVDAKAKADQIEHDVAERLKDAREELDQHQANLTRMLDAASVASTQAAERTKAAEDAHSAAHAALSEAERLRDAFQSKLKALQDLAKG